MIQATPEIKVMKLADLKPAPYNPRTIHKKAMEGLRHSLRKFGVVEPIVWNKKTGHVIGGHQRLKALREEGGDETLVVVLNLSEAEEKALNTTLNNPRIQGDWAENIETVLKEVQVELPDIFGDLCLNDLLDDIEKQVEEPKEDVIPQAPKAPITKPGDLILLGDHRVLCGDSTKAEDVRRLMNGALAHMVFTDPPYGVNYAAPSGRHAVLKGDEKTDDDLAGNLLMPSFKHAVKNTTESAGFYVWHASTTRDDFSYAMKAAGLMELQYLIWAKPYIGIGYSDYRWCHEPCFYAGKTGHKPAFYGDKTQSTIWRVSQPGTEKTGLVLGPGIVLLDGQGGTLFMAGKVPKNRKFRRIRIPESQSAVLQNDMGQGTVWEVSRDHMIEHPTQKPVELARRAIENSSKAGQLVLDPFLGSGTTLIGAEVTGRKCCGIELDPRYCDVITSRWERLTGKKAIRHSGVNT